MKARYDSGRELCEVARMMAGGWLSREAARAACERVRAQQCTAVEAVDQLGLWLLGGTRTREAWVHASTLPPFAAKAADAWACGVVVPRAPTKREQAISIEADSLAVALVRAQEEAEELLSDRRYCGTDSPRDISNARLELKSWAAEWRPWESRGEKWHSAFQFLLAWEESDR